MQIIPHSTPDTRTDGSHGEVPMRYYKVIDNGYIVMVGTGNGGTETTGSEYNSIMCAVANRPTETETIGYRLRGDLSWESYEKELPDISDEVSPEEISEALDSIL